MAASYENRGLVDCTVAPDLSTLKGKSVLVTGGSSGLGLAYAEAFLSAGAYVTNADIKAPEKSYDSSQYQYIPCDVRSYNAQLQAFKAIVANAPTKQIDIVIANAGIVGPDPLLQFDDADEEPPEPDLKITQINFIGVLHTLRLALWYFQKHGGEDPCLVLKSSLAGYLDLGSAPSYQSAKFGVRGLMCSLRRVGRFRCNVVAPWYIATPIMSETVVQRLSAMLEASNSDFAHTEDSVKAVLRIACDKSINGRAFGVMPRNVRSEGYMDLGLDDYEEGTTMWGMQNITKGASHRALPKEQQATS